MESYENEEQFQAACMTWYWNKYKDQMCYAVDNNVSHRLNARDRILEGNRKKAIGIRAGVFDAVYVGDGFHAYIDFKMPGNDYSDEQLLFLDRITKRGHRGYKVYPPINNFIKLIQWLQKERQPINTGK